MQIDFHPPVKQLLVDLDGTLLGNRNLSLSFDFVRKTLGKLSPYGGKRKAASLLLAMNREFKRPSREFTNDLRVLKLFSERMNFTIEESRGIISSALTVIFPSLRKHFYPIPGAKDFLHWAKDHYPMILATNPVWPPEIMELRVRWAGIDPALFHSITDARRMHACKPEVQYYEEILAQENLRAEDCLLIGNELKMDLPATKAGIRVFIVGPFKRTTRLELKGARAPAWRGSYAALRQALEHGLPSPSS